MAPSWLGCTRRALARGATSRTLGRKANQWGTGPGLGSLVPIQDNSELMLSP